MIPTDKLLHFLVGIAIVAFLYPISIVASIIALIAIAAGKEVWDFNGNGTPEVMDAIATILGGMILLGWFIIF